MLTRRYLLIAGYCGAGVMQTVNFACSSPPSGGIYDYIPWDEVCWTAFPGIGIASILLFVGITIYFVLDKIIKKIFASPEQTIPREYLVRQHWDLSRVLAHITYSSKQGWATRRKVMLASMAAWFAVKHFNDGAYGQTLRSSGRPRSHAVYETVDPQYWRSAKIAEVAALRPNGTATRTEPRGFYLDGIRHYDDFLFSEEDVLAIWPIAPLWLRCWSWLVIVAKRVWLELVGLAQVPARVVVRYRRRKERA